MKVLVTGISGKMGRLVAHQLLESGHEVIGVDRRPWRDAPDGVEMHETDIRKRAAEDVFRTRRPDAAIHMATVTHILKSSGDRFRINLGGTRAVFEHAHRYGVKRAIFVGRHTYYGAAPDSPLYHTEEEPPLGLESFPELADLVAADLYAGAALWRFPKIQTAVLRVCYTLGPARHGTLANFLQNTRVPMVLGFDPLFQFMHEDDVARAVATTLDSDARGVFNVCGPAPLPLSVIIRRAGRSPLTLPEGLLLAAMGRFGIGTLPKGAIDHIKYPVVIDGADFRETTGFSHEHDEYDTIDAFRASLPRDMR
jgi:UDP-glucose 4-epimerase